MHISLTPELEAHIKNRGDSGHYNNASEVVREALQKKLAVGEQQAANNQFVEQGMAGIIREAKAERKG